MKGKVVAVAVITVVLLVTIFWFFRSTTYPSIIDHEEYNTWSKSCENKCVQKSTTSIPKHMHFISLNRPFSFLEWLAVVSARNKIKPDKITVYTDGLQDSCWWRRALPYVEHQLLHLLPGSHKLNNADVKKWAHKSDFIRTSILYNYGGIYMDTDSISLNSFDPLLSNQVVLGLQCNNAVGIGVMVAQKHSCFICKCAHRSCQNFDGGWVTHSVHTMRDLVEEVGSEEEGLVILPVRSGFYPLCFDAEGLRQLYMEGFGTLPLYSKSEIYAVHLFANKVKTIKFPISIDDMDWIQNSKSLVALAVRETLPAGFSEEHFNTEKCTSLQLGD